MSWKRVLYVLFVIVVAGIAALSGAVAGGLAVYRAIGPADNPSAATPELSSAQAEPVSVEPVKSIPLISRPPSRLLSKKPARLS